jgi:hypothetical protein
VTTTDHQEFMIEAGKTNELQVLVESNGQGERHGARRDRPSDRRRLLAIEGRHGDLDDYTAMSQEDGTFVFGWCRVERSSSRSRPTGWSHRKAYA